MDKRDLEVRLRGNTADYEKAMKKAEAASKSFGDNTREFLGGAVATASRVAAVGLGVLGAAAFSMAKSASESEIAIADLDSVIKSTGGAAGVSSEQAQKLATSLQNVTGYSDEAIIKSEAMLMTFTKIGKDVFPEATEATLNMARKFGTDASQAAIQLGKALNDPIKGVTALRKIGVAFNETQTKQIEGFVKAGKVQEAQKIILKELNVELGGAARAYGTTFAGKLDIFMNKLDDAKEIIGEFILAGLDPLLDKALQFIDGADIEGWAVVAANAFLQAKDNFIQMSAPIVQFLKDHKDTLISFFERFGGTLLVLIPTLAVLAASVALVSNPLVLLAAGITAATYLWDNHRAAVIAITAALTPLIFAMVALKVSMMFTSTIEALRGSMMILNTAIKVVTGTNIAATAATYGMRSAFIAAAATASAGLVFAVGVAAIIYAIVKIREMKAAWDAAGAAARAAEQSEDSFWRNLRNNPNMSAEQKKAAGQRYNQSINGRATGGPVEAGTPYIVGERGPELFVPNGSGSIVPNHKIANVSPTPTPSAQSSNVTISVEVNMGMYAGMPVEKRAIAIELWREIVREARSNGVQLPQIGVTAQ